MGDGAIITNSGIFLLPFTAHHSNLLKLFSTNEVIRSGWVNQDSNSGLCSLLVQEI